MELSPYVDKIQRQLITAAAAGGDDARALAERLLPPLEAATRLALQDALAVAAEEITCELAPGSIELRLRGGSLEFVVTPPPVDQPGQDEPGGVATATGTTPSVEGDESGMSRINLRMPEQLKARVEQSAGGEGLSVNAWLVRAAGAALDRADPGRGHPARAAQGPQRYTGWAR